MNIKKSLLNFVVVVLITGMWGTCAATINKPKAEKVTKLQGGCTPLWSRCSHTSECCIDSRGDRCCDSDPDNHVCTPIITPGVPRCTGG